MVGHLDVVPPTDEDRTLRLEERDGALVAVGRGTSDMHGGNAVALELFTTHAHDDEDRPHDLVLVLYAREEGPAADNELADVLEAVAWLRQLDLAVVLEPTDGEVQAGCLGGLHATVRFLGQPAHSAPGRSRGLSLCRPNPCSRRAKPGSGAESGRSGHRVPQPPTWPFLRQISQCQ